MSSPGPGTGNGASRYAASLAIRSGSRLVARTRTSSQACSRPAHSSAAAPITCSQLSSTSSSCRRASTAPAPPAAGIPGCSRTPSATATADGTCAGSRTGASSASHTPSANRAATRPATAPASRVLPTPPGPVTVTSRCSSSRPATSRTAAARPTKLVSAAENPCMPPAVTGGASAAARRLAASTSPAGARPRAAATNTGRTGSARPSAPASSRAVSLRAVRLMPRSRSLTDRGLRPAASASSFWVSAACARSCRSNPAKSSTGGSAMTGRPPSQALTPPGIRPGRNDLPRH